MEEKCLRGESPWLTSQVWCSWICWPNGAQERIGMRRPLPFHHKIDANFWNWNSVADRILASTIHHGNKRLDVERVKFCRRQNSYSGCRRFDTRDYAQQLSMGSKFDDIFSKQCRVMLARRALRIPVHESRHTDVKWVLTTRSSQAPLKYELINFVKGNHVKTDRKLSKTSGAWTGIIRIYSYSIYRLLWNLKPCLSVAVSGNLCLQAIYAPHDGGVYNTVPAN